MMKRFFLIALPALACAMGQSDCLLVLNHAVAEAKQLDHVLQTLKQAKQIDISLRILQQGIGCCRRSLEQYEFILNDLARHSTRKEWRRNMKQHCEEKREKTEEWLKELQLAFHNLKNEAYHLINTKAAEGKAHFEEAQKLLPSEAADDQLKNTVQCYREAVLLAQELSLYISGEEKESALQAIDSMSQSLRVSMDTALQRVFQQMDRRALEGKRRYESHDLDQAKKCYEEAVALGKEALSYVLAEADQGIIQQRIQSYLECVEICQRT